MDSISESRVRAIIREELETFFDKIIKTLSPYKSTRQPFDSYSDDMLQSLKMEALNQAIDLGGIEKFTEVNNLFNQEHDRRRMVRFKQCMESGKPAEAFVYSNKVFRKGAIVDGLFYFQWGSEYRSLPIEKINMITKQ